MKTVLLNPYIPHEPTTKQAEFLVLDNREAFYGGAARGGKTDALLMAALQYVDVPGYSALILRRTLTSMKLSQEGIMSRLRGWLEKTDAYWNGEDKVWYFPAGSSIKLGYCEHEEDVYQYQGAGFQFIGFDELTQFSETQYRYLISRLSGPNAEQEPDNPLLMVPQRIRAASNPGGRGHVWVKQRFISNPNYQDLEGNWQRRPFIPAKLDDNPFVDQRQYRESLMQLDPVRRAQLLEGDWDVSDLGGKFQRDWFDIVPQSAVPQRLRRVRVWDLASTVQHKGNRDPDWTVGLLLGVQGENFYVLDVVRTRSTPKEVERLIYETARRDGIAVQIHMEQEPGASGKALVDHYRHDILRGFPFYARRSTGSKEARSNPVAAMAEAGHVKLLEANWNGDFLDELVLFPAGSHDDQVDTLSSGYLVLTGKRVTRDSIQWVY